MQMLINFLLLTIGFTLLELIYFYIAQKYDITDRPNLRSSHNYITIRGGGIIFPISVLLCLSYSESYNIAFGVGILVISILSFVDDIRSVNSKWRLLIQILTVGFTAYPFLNELTWIWLPLCVILLVGVINAYNFMDGINGITVMYSIVNICMLFWISVELHVLFPPSFFLSILASLTVFAFFNIRKKAKCFAGDVGSVSIAFVICFLILKLILITKWPYWLFLMGVYGIDTFVTIFFRIFRKENLMQAHRSHFYQFLVNERGLSHIKVSLIYSISQLLLSLDIIFAYELKLNYIVVLSFLIHLSIYLVLRLRMEGFKRLLVNYNDNV